MQGITPMLQSHINMARNVGIVSQDESDGYYSAGSVTFIPGARTHPYRH